MFLNIRLESLELKLLKSLNRRMKLSSEVKQYYLNLMKGFEGEQAFDNRLEILSDDWLIISDLLLENNNTLFQIDSLLISHDTIYIIEVKNFEGDYYIDSDRWYSKSGKEIKNPLLQLKRSESLFRRLLQDLGFNFLIETHLIVINPEFTLYQAPLDLPIIFPSQLNRFLKRLNMKTPRTNKRHIAFAERLLSERADENAYSRIPNYDYEQLEKGIICSSCSCFLTTIRDRRLVCDSCGLKEDVETAVMRSVGEFKMLFPEIKVTTNSVFDWCRVIGSKKTIQRILSKNLKCKGQGKYSYYEDS